MYDYWGSHEDRIEAGSYHGFTYENRINKFSFIADKKLPFGVYFRS